MQDKTRLQFPQLIGFNRRNDPSHLQPTGLPQDVEEAHVQHGDCTFIVDMSRDELDSFVQFEIYPTHVLCA